MINDISQNAPFGGALIPDYVVEDIKNLRAVTDAVAACTEASKQWPEALNAYSALSLAVVILLSEGATVTLDRVKMIASKQAIGIDGAEAVEMISADNAFRIEGEEVLLNADAIEMEGGE